MNTFTVFLFINHSAKTFSLSCRNMASPGNPVEAMKEQEGGLGFERLTLAEGLTEQVGRQMKNNLTTVYELAGYLKVTRQPV